LQNKVIVSKCRRKTEMSEMTLEKFKKPTLKVGKSSDSSLYSRRLRKMKFENVNNFIY